MNTIPRETAWGLCQAAQNENRGRWYTFNGLWCSVCARQARGDLTRLCFHYPPDYRGCAQVNQRFDRQAGVEHKA